MQKSYDKPRQCIKKQKHHFTDKGPYSQMATHSSVLAWRIPWVGEPGGLLSMGLPRVGHDWSDLAAPKNWLKIVVLEKTLESPLDSMDIKSFNPKENQPWIFIGRTDAEADTPILWPPDVKTRPWCWERLNVGGAGDDRGWDGWMASLMTWTWDWVSYGNWCWTGRPGMLQSMGSQRVGHDWATELNWGLDNPTLFDLLLCQTLLGTSFCIGIL